MSSPHGRSGLLLALLVAGAAGCSDASMEAGANDAAARTDAERDPSGADPRLEESDIYEIDGDFLYVQNETSGLAVIDIAEPAAPSAVARVQELQGAAGELYVDGEQVVVVFEGEAGLCQLPNRLEGEFAHIPERSEIVTLVGAPRAPTVAAEFCIPGTTVTTRKLGERLFVVSESTETLDSWIYAFDLDETGTISLVESRYFRGEAQEIHATAQAIYLVQPVGDDATRITYVDITAADASLVDRGSVEVEGAPAGRFHMDEHEGMFRIVTTSSSTGGGSHLFAIDVTRPDDLRVRGSLTDLAVGEELWATRFDGEMAYIVTYFRETPEPTDPLWVVSLEDPAAPELLGELVIPGWSTFVYPRGDRLVAVGRGDEGNHVAASLFDVSNPRDPREITRLDFGLADASSQAESDFRSVSILEDELGATPLVTVPFTNNIWGEDGCEPEHGLQLIDLEEDGLDLRGVWSPRIGESGLIRRTRAVGGLLYTVTDRGVAAIEVSDRDDPFSVESVDVAGAAYADNCVPAQVWGQPAMPMDGMACSTAPGNGPSRASLVLAAALAVVGICRRRPA